MFVRIYISIQLFYAKLTEFSDEKYFVEKLQGRNGLTIFGFVTQCRIP